MSRLVPLSLLLVVAACGHARLVSRTQYGGVFALEGDRNKAMEDAHGQMSAHCRGPYTIVSEGENVIGSDSAQANETYVAEDGTVVNQGGASTRQATEWRVQYQCGQSQTVPSQPSPYAQPPGGAYPPPGGAYTPPPGTAPQPPPPPPGY
jgi:hypothetical protein